MASESNRIQSAQDEDVDAESFYEPGLFLDLNYAISTVQFEHVTVQVKTLQSGSTDFDLTGQIVWPAALLLSNYLVEHPSEFQNAGSILEVGSGIGVSGLVAAKLHQKPASVVLSDYSQIVLDVLRENVTLNFPEESAAPRCAALAWGSDLSDFIENHGLFQCIIGADVVYWPDLVAPLLQTVEKLLSHEPNSFSIISYISRSAQIDRLFESTVIDLGFNVERIQLDGKCLALAENERAAGKDGILFRLTRVPKTKI
ncbi:hypothetical protein CAOG_04564 [Capsaspora owczarzaki ATCC 30864]|uniref:Uncharacterized protein n=1 Tax=Capsaspora owczarzaki (strain ATCC 30864) TaxID=595528 RepID=A0A0D2WRH2_CAPO3|nr:hypothetical protein CAOG_04564 [Capsaspora owczarzaki ATCC 30864]KJE93833.1 hypothetical protein CAOG_004564 [Capsaspora owczarzaki ATCC 30864]|eukprot:XP_004347311.1 hypothetical protein CAOG_04564 [Capsaspora owczarzaki ATCC 30864]